MCWNIANAILTWLVAYFTDLPTQYAPIILIALNMITKYINSTYFDDLWVQKQPSPLQPTPNA